MNAPAIRTTCPYCGVGCGVLVERAGEGYAVRGDPDHPANLGRLCSKGAALADTLGLDDRITHARVDGRTAPLATALDTVARRLRAVIDAHGPQAVAFYVSGQLLTEDYYVANKLMKGFIGGGNIDTNSRLCMSSAVAGHKRGFGADAVPGCYEDVELADLVVLAGSNAAWTHPVLFQRLAAAKKARPAMRVVLIDPRRTATAELADLHLALAPGSDAWLFHGLLNHLRRDNAIDWRYLETRVSGFGAALAEVAGLDPARVAEHCALPPADVATFYDWFARTPRTVTLFSQGINQSSSGVDKVNAILNVHLATGRVGLHGASPISLTGQPNAMGGREVGGLANQLAAHMDYTPDDVDRVGRFWRAPAMAQADGLKAVELFEAVRTGRVKALWIMATNPAVSLPEADAVVEALRACEFLVVSDVTARTDTARHAHVLLPAAAWGEKDGTVTNSERRISRQRAFMAPPGEARPDWWLVAEVARRLGHGDTFAYRGPADILREHAALSAFENGGRRVFDIGALAALDDAGYERLAPVQWPLPAGCKTGAQRLFASGGYAHGDGRARMLAAPPRGPALATEASRPLRLNTGRIRDQWHSMTRTGSSARLFAHLDEPYVELNPRDARAAGVEHGGLARLAGGQGELLARVRVTADQPAGSAFVPIHWNDRFCARGRVDALIDAITDPISGQPEFKHAPVALAPYVAAWHGFVMARRPLDCAGHDYWARARGVAHWRHELADTAPCTWVERLRAEFGADGDWIELRDAAAGRHRLALLRDGRVELVAFIERSAAQLPPRAWLAGLFARARLDAAERAGLLAGRPADSAADVGRVVCACFGVGEKTLLAAIAAGAGSVEALGIALKAGSNCGSCVPELTRMLEAR